MSKEEASFLGAISLTLISDMKRDRKKYLLLIGLTILLGLLSRTSFIPEIIYPYLGDLLYATMFFFIVGFIFPKMKSFSVALISLIICCLIECSQLLNFEWLNQLRSYRLGGLILGYGFLWSDILAYALGNGLGWLVEFIFRSKIT